ncbi:MULTISPECIES: lysozyme inhibitor LprI family protein [unclassified Stenotrophomonas]|uniref:lysozyme inhibitor LprI family protein n=2 Tax=Stenotrophomonas TaxID=40323 RepID=UPI0021182503
MEHYMLAQYTRIPLRALLLAGLVASATATAATAAAPAASKGVSASYTSCEQRAHGAIEQAACISQEKTRQDQRLNRVYKQLQARLDAPRKAKLVAAQRAWLTSRELDGRLEAVLYDDSQPGNLQGSQTDMLRLSARADQLQRYLDLLD